MSPKRAALVGVVFVVISIVYLAVQYAADPNRVDYAGVTMLLALGVATSVMAYVLVDGMQQRS
jgi:drug/metabolite transporter superfamily protein YnfA